MGHPLSSRLLREVGRDWVWGLGVRMVSPLDRKFLGLRISGGN